MAFTTWAALKTKILDDIANGSVLTQAYSSSDKTHTFRSMADVITFLKYVDLQIAAEESGTVRRGPTVRGVTPL